MRLNIVHVVVALGVLTHLSGGISEEPPADRGLVRYLEGPWPTQDLGVITDDNRDALNAASEMADFHKSDFANVYVDHDGTVVLVPVNTKGEEVAVAAFGRSADVHIGLDTSALSIGAASDAGGNLYEESDELARKISAWKGDPRSSRLIVVVWQPLDPRDRSQIEEFATQNSLAIDVYLDPGDPPAEKDSRLEDDPPVAGAFRYTLKNGSTSSAVGLATGWCTGGFGYHIGSFEYVLTAGHCIEKGTPYKYMWNTYAYGPTAKKTYLGSSAGSVWNDGVGSEKAADGEYHGDIVLVSVGNSGGQMWWGTTNTTNKIPVTARRIPTLNDPVCINGVVSGSDCGLTVVDVNINHTYADGDVLRNGDKGSSPANYDCSQGGDSGGPIVYNHAGTETQATGIGIISGHTDRNSNGCYQWFTGIEEANQVWGGEINFN